MTVVLNWVKAHWLIVLFCAIILVSIPTLMFFGEDQNSLVKQEISSRVRKIETSLSNVEKTEVKIQPLLPGAATFDERMVVTETILDEYRNIRKAIKQNSDEIAHEAMLINREDHVEELVPGLLPAPDVLNENALPYNIHPAYIKAHEELLASLHAGGPVSDDTLGATLEDFQNTYIRTQLNRELNESLDDEEEAKLVEAMTARRLLEYRQRAGDISVYADLSVFNLKDWDTSRGAPPPALWFDWQHAYWVDQDIVKAINKANSSGSGDSSQPDSVAGQPSSVVKRIINIGLKPMFDIRAKKRADEFDDANYGGEGGFGLGEGGMMEGGGSMMEGGSGFAGKGGSGMCGGGEYGEPGGGTSSSAAPSSNDDPSIAFEDNFSNSISGRTSNALYDVREVVLTLIVDSNRLPTLINAIQSTNFMTVTGCQMQSINVINHLRDGYYYGTDPVVQVELTIETLWLREWTTKLMPDDVKESLGIAIPKDEDATNSDDG